LLKKDGYNTLLAHDGLDALTTARLVKNRDPPLDKTGKRVFIQADDLFAEPLIE
jgi:hypothetical protein